MSLPEQIGLCPVHFAEFYMPHGGLCPVPDCDRALTIYHRERYPSAQSRPVGPASGPRGSEHTGCGDVDCAPDEQAGVQDTQAEGRAT